MNPWNLSENSLGTTDFFYTSLSVKLNLTCLGRLSLSFVQEKAWIMSEGLLASSSLAERVSTTHNFFVKVMESTAYEDTWITIQKQAHMEEACLWKKIIFFFLILEILLSIMIANAIKKKTKPTN